MNTITHKLDLIADEMHLFVSPENTKGFYRQFILWVCENWTEKKVFATSIEDTGYDYSSFPVRTNKPLSEHCKCYKEFINSNTGNSVCTFTPNSGMACENFYDKLQELFKAACTEQVKYLIKYHNISVPEKYKNECVNVSDLILFDVIDEEQDPALYDICDYIRQNFVMFHDDLDRYYDEDSEFSNLTLKDFKTMLEGI